MFGWLRKPKDAPRGAPRTAVDPVLRDGVETLVAFLYVDPGVDDPAVMRHLTASGLSEPQATRLVQFVPIAFTRFLYRSRGVRFAPDYALMGPKGELVDQRPIAAEPAFRAAWAHCEEAAAGGAGDNYFTPIAARSGGYCAIDEMLRQGLNLSGVITSPPVIKA